MTRLIINTDGGSRGNPGQAASAFIIEDSGGEITSGGATLGIATNNQAEYTAVKLALEKLTEDFNEDYPLDVEVRADSLLVVKQLSGEYKIKSQELLKTILEIKKLEGRVGKVSYKYIPRAENYQADKLVNKLLDGLR